MTIFELCILRLFLKVGRSNISLTNFYPISWLPFKSFPNTEKRERYENANIWYDADSKLKSTLSNRNPFPIITNHMQKPILQCITNFIQKYKQQMNKKFKFF